MKPFFEHLFEFAGEEGGPRETAAGLVRFAAGRTGSMPRSLTRRGRVKR
jgi:hypothetical protein